MAGHAGTVPMALRRDALAAAAEMVLAVERGGAGEPELVGTVGQIEALPGAINVIPGKRRASPIDLRAPARRARGRRASRRLRRRCAGDRASGAASRLEATKTHDAPAAACDPALVEALGAAIAGAGIAAAPAAERRRPRRHGDGRRSARSACCSCAADGGISHNPAESDHGRRRRDRRARPARLPAHFRSQPH